MKHADQNPMDVLLRSLGRRDGAVSALANDQRHSPHLDADELNAFAEGMLPDRARARYSEHLADCSSCRSVIVQLSQASGVAVSRQKMERPRAPFWEGLTQIFAQPVLRYALPAIVLISVLGIGILMLRQDGQEQFVARHQPSLEPAPQPNVNSPNQTVPSQTPPPPGSSSATLTKPEVVASAPVDGPRGESTGQTAVSPAPPIAGVARKGEDAQPAEATPTFAPDLNAAAPPPPMPGYAARDRAAADRAATLSKEAPKREADQAQADELRVQTRRNDDEAPAPAAKAAGSRARTGNVQGLMTERRSEDKNKKDSDSGQSRTVSGKRFVRHDDAWIDSAYKSSATTNVKRGSEQYRALIADEAGLRAFAEQLSGEVIVVWKSRAYRFY